MSARSKCAACGSESSRFRYQVGSYRLVRCGDCGLMWVSDPPLPDELQALYGEAYWEDPQTQGYRGYAGLEFGKRRHFASLLDVLERFHPPERSVLEIGCAYGFFLDEARKRGWRVQGVEFSPFAAAFARDRLGLEVSVGGVEQLGASAESVGVVVMWDVIEHLPDPAGAVCTAARILRPEGLLALSTGDVGSLAARIHGRSWSLLTPPWHLFYFTRRSLRFLLQRSGFSILWTGGDGVVAADPASPRPRLPRWLTGALLHPSVTRLFRFLGRGSVVFLCARKAAVQ